MKHNFEKFCKDYEKIENYDKAKAVNFKGWDCHHRLETHTSDGERRLVDITVAELQALGMYYHRPADELIFLKIGEHSRLHMKGNQHSKGKKRSEETKQKLSEVNKGKHHSDETKKKIAETMKGRQTPWAKGNTNTKGMHWYNNGKENKFCYECPEGFVAGRIK